MDTPPTATFFGQVANVRQPLSAEVNEVITDQNIERWLFVASEIIRGRFASLDTLVAAGKVDLDKAATVAELAAERVARNPDGWRAFGIDNGNATRDHALSDGQVKILPHEWAMIYPDGARAATQTAHGLTLGTPLC